MREIVTAWELAGSGQLDASKISAYLATLGQQGKSVNGRLTAIKGFTKWMYDGGRVRTDPLKLLKRDLAGERIDCR